MSAERTLVRTVGMDELGAAEEFGGAVGDPYHRRRPPCRRGGERGGEHRACGVVHADRCHQDVDDAAAGQTDREGVLVAVAELLPYGDAVIEGLLAQFVHRTLHTPAGDRTDRVAVAVDGEGGSRLPGRAPADRHDRGDGELASLPDPPVKLFGDVQHGVSP